MPYTWNKRWVFIGSDGSETQRDGDREHCPDCGHKLDDGAATCATCGAAFSEPKRHRRG